MLNVQGWHTKGLLSMKNKPGIHTTKRADTKTGTWRQEKPIVSEKCIACGICEVLCPVKAIAMIEEEE